MVKYYFLNVISWNYAERQRMQVISSIIQSTILHIDTKPLLWQTYNAGS
jgi:hypothetical protein